MWNHLQTEPRTLLELLFRNETLFRDRVAFDFWIGDNCHDSLTYGELTAAARAAAMRFAGMNVAGREVLLLHPPGLDFIVDFFGCLLAGGVAVPMPPPDRKSDRNRILAVCDLIQPAVIVLGRDATVEKSEFCKASSRGACVIRSARAFAGSFLKELPGAHDLAVIQFTSGSSGAPKGAPLTHEAILFNLSQIASAFDFRTRDRHEAVVLWLPHYHDMGLFGRLECLFAACTGHLFSHNEFVRRPQRWMDHVSKLGATVTGAPNFAFELASKSLGSSPLDLSKLRVAFCGSEPIVHRALEQFVEAHLPSGLDPYCVTPCYGMAEATLMVSCHVPGEPLKILEPELSAKVRGYGSNDAIISCGAVCSGTDLIVVDPETGEQMDQASSGELCIAGTNVIKGYCSSSGALYADDSFLTVDVSGEEKRFLRTGDLGFIAGGHLYVVGRKKAVIIINGQNIHPHDIERSIEASHQMLRLSRVVALPARGEFGESCAIVIEIPQILQKKQEKFPEVFAAVRKVLHDQHNVDPAHIMILRRGGIMWTTSGKIARSETLAAYEAGLLKPFEEWPAKRGPRTAAENVVADRLADIASQFLGGRVVDMALSIPAQGGDSLTSIRIHTELRRAYGNMVLDSDLISPRSLAEFADNIDGRLIKFVDRMSDAEARTALHLIESER